MSDRRSTVAEGCDGRRSKTSTQGVIGKETWRNTGAKAEAGVRYSNVPLLAEVEATNSALIRRSFKNINDANTPGK